MFPSLTAVSTFNPSFEPPLHVTALERHFGITVSLNMQTVNLEISGKTFTVSDY
jgi:hypothetical protein